MVRKKKAVLADEVAAKLLGLVPPAELPPQHQIREYKSGWDYQRAERQRQQIAITKPTAYKQVALKKVVEKMPITPPKKGLYAKAMETSNLQSVDLSVATAGVQLKKGINCIQN